MKLTKLYLLLATLVGLIGTSIALGVFLFTVVNRAVISDDDYIISNRRQIENCEQDGRDAKTETSVTKTDEEIATCKDEARVHIIEERRVQGNESIVASLTRGLVALLVFVGHGLPFWRVRDK